MTIEIDNKVRKYAPELHDGKLLSKVASGDMVPIDAAYAKCQVAFYNRARQKYSNENPEDESVGRLHVIGFAQLVSYMEGFRECEETVPVFTLADLSKMCRLYASILGDLGVDQAAGCIPLDSVRTLSQRYLTQRLTNRDETLY